MAGRIDTTQIEEMRSWVISNQERMSKLGFTFQEFPGLRRVIFCVVFHDRVVEVYAPSTTPWRKKLAAALVTLRKDARAIQAIRKARASRPSRFRIVDGDNFDGDYPDEKFLQIGESIYEANQEQAEAVAKALNVGASGSDPRHWRVVPDDYKLAPGFEP